MKKCLFTLLLVLVSLRTGAQESQTAYNFLRLPASAHAAALGGDNITLIEDDAALTLHNPALLSSVSDRTLMLGYMNYFSGASVATASFTKVVGERSTVAATARYIGYGTMKEVDEWGTQTGTFSPKDIDIAAHFAYLLSDRLAGGISARFITSYIGSYNSIAAAIDLGINYFDEDKDWSVSLVAKNLGGQLKTYDEERERMPIDVQAGVTHKFPNMPFRLSLTFVDLNHLNYRFADHCVVGADLLLSDRIYLAGGYNFRRNREMKVTTGEGEESSHGAGLSMGAGLTLEKWKLHVAYGKYHVSSHSLLLNLAFTL